MENKVNRNRIGRNTGGCMHSIHPIGYGWLPTIYDVRDKYKYDKEGKWDRLKDKYT